jgi:hypothetical protein
MAKGRRFRSHHGGGVAGGRKNGSRISWPHPQRQFLWRGWLAKHISIFRARREPTIARTATPCRSATVNFASASRFCSGIRPSRSSSAIQACTPIATVMAAASRERSMRNRSVAGVLDRIVAQGLKWRWGRESSQASFKSFKRYAPRFSVDSWAPFGRARAKPTMSVDRGKADSALAQQDFSV